MSCEKHKKDLFGETDMKKVAEMIGNLHYESLYELLYHLSIKIGDDGLADDKDGKEQLSERLRYCAGSLYTAYMEMESAWKISKPFMNEKPQP